MAYRKAFSIRTAIDFKRTYFSNKGLKTGSIGPLVALVLVLSGCSTLEPITPRIWRSQAPQETSIERITALFRNRVGDIDLFDGRGRMAEHLRLYPDSLSYVIVPENRPEAVGVTQVRPIDVVRTSRLRGIYFGASVGAVMGAIAGPILEFWAGNRGGPLALSAPLYGGAWGLIGAGIGAITGARIHYRYEAPAPQTESVPIADE